VSRNKKIKQKNLKVGDGFRFDGEPHQIFYIYEITDRTIRYYNKDSIAEGKSDSFIDEFLDWANGGRVYRTYPTFVGWKAKP